MSNKQNKYGLSRTIPDDIKRAIRQDCGFGCVCCGLAIASYEHIDPEFCEAKSHDPDKMAFLCEGCHSRVTRKFWSKQKVREAREIPYCVHERRCHDAFDIGDNELIVWVASNRIVNIETIFKVDDTILLSIEPPEASGGPFRLSGQFYDEQGNFLFKILRNEWFGEASNWDIECVGGRIIVRTESKKIALQILCDPPRGIVIEKMNMFYQNTQFVTDNYELRVRAHDKGKIIISGREIVAKSEGCVAFTAVSKGGQNGNNIQGGGLIVGTGGALMMGGGGTFSVGALPKPSDLPKSLKGEYAARHWGTIRTIVPEKKKSVGRNDPCTCQSGLKYKKCCGK